MTPFDACVLINTSSPKEARKIALKLVSSLIIEGNLINIELVKKKLGIGYYNHILLELSVIFQTGKKK